MRRWLTGLTVVAGLLVAAPLASAAPLNSNQFGVGLPLYSPSSATARPPGFTSDANQAMAAAKATPTMKAIHQREHPLSLIAELWGGTRWQIYFTYDNKDVAEVDVNRAGHVTGVWTGPLVTAQYARGHYGGLFDSLWVVIPFGIMFLAPFFDFRRPWRLHNLDILVLLSFGVSYLLFNKAQLEPAVWLAYPPLLYLMARMLAIGLRKERPPKAWPPAVPTKALAVGLLALIGARIGLDIASNKVIDVGYASVIGGYRALHGLPLYYSSPGNGDTYGPIAYLAYAPFQLLFPWHGGWGYLASARAAAITFDFLTTVGLVVLGMRIRPGGAGRRLGLTLGWAWAAFPFTLFGLMNNTNDGLVAMLLVFALIGFASPRARGLFLGLAAAAKFAPAALLPLFAGRARGGGWKATLQCVVAFAFVAVGAIALYLPSGGISEFYNHTLGFQLTRTDVFSPWGLHPSLTWLKTVLEVAALGLAAALAFIPRQRSFVQVCALSAAVLIAIELPAEHWFYFYILWFAPFVFVALLAREVGVAPAAVTASERTHRIARRRRLRAAPEPQRESSRPRALR